MTVCNKAFLTGQAPDVMVKLRFKMPKTFLGLWNDSEVLGGIRLVTHLDVHVRGDPWID
uniref:Uncharacterized protein n=1 Tax=Anguilla anguilla TaxID=7936 RepID=A0A0E9RVN2_ANGAN